MGTASMAKDSARPVRTRVVLCAGITLLAWASVAALLWVLRRPN
jgi:hypothetical protein